MMRDGGNSKNNNGNNYPIANYYDLDDNVGADGLFEDASESFDGGSYADDDGTYTGDNGFYTGDDGPYTDDGGYGDYPETGYTEVEIEDGAEPGGNDGLYYDDEDRGDHGPGEEDANENGPNEDRPSVLRERDFSFGNSAANSRRFAENLRRREAENERIIEAERGEKDIFGEYINEVGAAEISDAVQATEEEKRLSQVRHEKKKKAERDEEKKEEREAVWDSWLQRPAFYTAAAVLFICAVLAVVCGVAATSRSAKKAVEEGVSKVSKGGEPSGDGGTLYAIVDAYKDFIGHDANVKAENDKNSAGTPNPSGGFTLPTATPFVPKETATPAGYATEAPAQETPSETPSGGTNTVPSGDEDYYVFDLGEKGLGTRRLGVGETFTSGVGTDRAGELLVSAGGKDIDYGGIRIQNPYNCDGFELRDVLTSPLTVRRVKTNEPTVLLYYTHTSEGYCLSEDERTVASHPSLLGYDKKRSIAGRGDVFERACVYAGTNVTVIPDVNDEKYDLAYETSAAAVGELAARTPSAQLALDLHANAFEYPTGTRYAPAAVKDGKRYAKVLFVITQNDEKNPNWRENVKLAIMIIEKMEKEVPGVSLGISLRKDPKYNTATTKFGLLCEVGFEGNLVGEADATAELLGRVIGGIFSGKY